MLATSDGQAYIARGVPGRYKVEPNHVLTATGKCSTSRADDVAAENGEMLQCIGMKKRKQELHPLVLAAFLHYRFVLIHSV